MKEVERYLAFYGIVMTVICLGLAMIAFAPMRVHQENATVNAKPEEVTTAIHQSEKYHLELKDGTVVILKDDVLFETTNITEDQMSDDLREYVENQTSFDSEEEVYAFLESYTS